MTGGERNRRGVAVHEAGHAVVCRLVDVPVETVTTEWSGTTHGALVYAGTPPPESLLLILLAGEAAVAHAHRVGWFEDAGNDDAPKDEHEPDRARVTTDAENIYAVLEQLCPGDRQAQERALREARERVDTEVAQHWDDVALVADALWRETTLSGASVEAVLSSWPRRGVEQSGSSPGS